MFFMFILSMFDVINSIINFYIYFILLLLYYYTLYINPIINNKSISRNRFKIIVNILEVNDFIFI